MIHNFPLAFTNEIYGRDEVKWIHEWKSSSDELSSSFFFGGGGEGTLKTVEIIELLFSHAPISQNF